MMPARDVPSPAASAYGSGHGEVRAILGPTNTGKTYLAVERMRGHQSGMIGFPLRLLARENYDRLVAAEGRASVALITGEEKIVPPRPRWWVCTVEAMPLHQRVDFLAVDEIQLCADPDRGHTFTDRLLHARGREETMFLGAASMAGVMRALVPEARIETRPRFSALSWAGARKLTRLPRRSAVVAFSVDQVYRMAEAVRRGRGGAAVVLGALSPRTRNAQVQMYQEGEVDYLVATDAIGMGLNMDVDHVAFAALDKFDGRRRRALAAPELGQIAGRAGRYMNDGTFGVTEGLPPLDEEVIRRIETHDFPTLAKVSWRNRDLDFATPGRLMNSLNEAPPRPELVRAREADDQQALAALLRDETAMSRAVGRDRVRLLWEVCQIPDFRKVMPDHHALLLGRIFGHLVDRDGVLPPDWVAEQIERLDRTEGDIDTLTARLAHVRTWTYITHRADWLADSAHWQARARQIEDALSDALHDRLTERFVDRRAAMLSRGREDGGEMLSAVTKTGEVVVEGHVVGRMEGLSFVPADATDMREAKALAAAAHRALREDAGPRVGRLAAAEDSAFGMTPDGRITWGGRAVARVARGANPLTPQVRLLANDLNDATLEERARQRLQDFLDGFLARRLGALVGDADGKAAADAPARGLLFRLREGLGAVPAGEAREQTDALSPEARKGLTALGVRFGTDWLFLTDALTAKAVRAKAILWAAWSDRPVPAVPNGPAPVLTRDTAPDEAWRALGYAPLGPVAVRVDRLERFLAALRQRARKGPIVADPALAEAAGLDPAAADLADGRLDGVLRALGFKRQRPPAGAAADSAAAAAETADAASGDAAASLRYRAPGGFRRASGGKSGAGARGRKAAASPAKKGAPGRKRAGGTAHDGGSGRKKTARKDPGKERGNNRPAPNPDSPFAVLQDLVRPRDGGGGGSS